MSSLVISLPASPFPLRSTRNTDKMLRQAVKSGRLATDSLARPSSYLLTVLQGMWVGERTQGVIFGNRAQIIPGRPPSSTVVKRES